jgi:hypothetical protein
MAAEVAPTALKLGSRSDQKQDEVPKPREANVKVDNFVDEEQQ